jgi:16S rRNA (guanine527-N7)-methyltransferase
MFSDEFDFDKLCEECHVQNIESFKQKVQALYDILIETNKHMNLTRIQSLNDYLNKHIADSLLIAKFFPNKITKPDTKIADIGCGGGFPSLVLASAFPELQVTPIDSTGKKINFVNTAAKELGLTNLEAFQGRACELNRKKEWQGEFDIITARAVAKSMKLFTETDQMLNYSGMYIFYKTPEQVADELEPLRKLSKKQCYNWHTTEIYELPAGNGKRQFIFGHN